MVVDRRQLAVQRLHVYGRDWPHRRPDNSCASIFLPGSSVTFNWTAAAGASQYWLYVGTKIGGVQYYNASTGTNLSAVVNGLPTDGRVLYVRLYSLVSGVWLFNDYTYTSGPGLTAPVPQSTLAGASATFNWSAGTGVTQYWLTVSGTSLGGTDLYNQSTGTARSASVSGLPTDGRTIYVRLWYLVGGSWLYSDYLYTASGAAQRPQMTAPAPGLTLAGTFPSLCLVRQQRRQPVLALCRQFRRRKRSLQSIDRNEFECDREQPPNGWTYSLRPALVPLRTNLAVQ